MSVEFTAAGTSVCITRTTHVIQAASGGSFGFWLQIPAYTNWNDPFHATGSSAYFGMESDSSGRLYAHRHNPAYVELELWADGFTGWAYIAGVTDGTNLAMYYQRQGGTWTSVGNLSGMGSIGTATGMSVGGEPTFDPDVNGTCRMREFRVWSTQLTPTQLQAELLSATPIVTSGLLSSNHLTTAATAATDSSAIAENWSVTGSPADNGSEPYLGRVGLHLTTHNITGTTLTTGSGTSATSGSAFVVAVVWFAGIGDPTVTDNKGNGTYTQVGSTVNFTAAPTAKMALFEKINGAGGSGHTFTATWSGGPAVATSFVLELTGGRVRDQAPGGFEDTSSPYVSNTTGTTTQAVEIVLAFCGTSSASGTEVITWGNSFNGIDYEPDATSFTGSSAYRIVSSTGTYQSSFTSAGAGTDAAISFIVTYKDGVVSLIDIIPPVVRESFLD